MTKEDIVQSSLDQLEFFRVLEHICSFAGSSLGVEHVKALSPRTDRDAIERDLGMVSEMRDVIERGEEIPLHGVYDIRNALSLSMIAGSYLGGEDFLAVLTTIASLRSINEFFRTRRPTCPLLFELTSDIHSNRLLERHIQDAIDESGQVRDNASRELFKIRREIIDRSAALRQRLQKILRRVADEELVTEEYVTLREGRLVLPVKTEFKRKIPGIIHGESSTGGTVFLEPAEIFDMNNEISELTFAERREVERILRTLTLELGADAQLFRASMISLQIVDSIMARARYAMRFHCSPPTITSSDVIRVVDARHPLLLVRLDRVVPMSISMDRENRCVVISGPNAGGKTVAMKTLGLTSMMALSGIHPPALECEVHPCRIFTDIGDQQSVENDLSTFSSHMSRIHDIIQHVSAGDIVLLDEIGTGTDPDEGGAIAASILEFLLSRQAFVLATTHHSYLKVFAFDTDFVVNAGMEFDLQTITPTYRFLAGMPGNSYAFELIARLGFEQRVIEAARSKLGEDRNRMTEIIEQLEENLAQSREAQEDFRRQRDEAKALREKLDTELREVLQRRNELIAEARQQARATMANANSVVENAIREIRAGASKDQVKELRRAMDDVRLSLTPTAEEHAETLAGFRKGDSVRIKGGTQLGELEFDPDEKGNVVVQFGALRMRSHVDDLEAASRSKVRREHVSSQVVINPMEVKTKLDLRGMYSDEAVVYVEQALSAAISANIAQLEIIHGKGTGALRKRIHELLTGYPGITDFRLGALTEGGAGVTIVTLK